MKKRKSQFQNYSLFEYIKRKVRVISYKAFDFVCFKPQVIVA